MCSGSNQWFLTETVQTPKLALRCADRNLEVAPNRSIILKDVFTTQNPSALPAVRSKDPPFYGKIWKVSRVPGKPLLEK